MCPPFPSGRKFRRNHSATYGEATETTECTPLTEITRRKIFGRETAGGEGDHWKDAASQKPDDEAAAAESACGEITSGKAAGKEGASREIPGR